MRRRRSSSLQVVTPKAIKEAAGSFDHGNLLLMRLTRSQLQDAGSACRLRDEIWLSGSKVLRGLTFESKRGPTAGRAERQNEEAL